MCTPSSRWAYWLDLQLGDAISSFFSQAQCLPCQAGLGGIIVLGLMAMREVGTFRGQALSCVAPTEFGLLQGLVSWGIPSAGREVGYPSLQVQGLAGVPPDSPSRVAGPMLCTLGHDGGAGGCQGRETRSLEAWLSYR